MKRRFAPLGTTVAFERLRTTGLECFAAAHGRTIRRQRRRRRWRLLRAHVNSGNREPPGNSACRRRDRPPRSIALSARSHTHTRCLFYTCTCEVRSYRTICCDNYFYSPAPVRGRAARGMRKVRVNDKKLR